MSDTKESSKPNSEESSSEDSTLMLMIMERLKLYFKVPDPLARNISFGLATILLILAGLTQLESFLFTEFFVLIWYYTNNNGIEDRKETNRVKLYTTIVIFSLQIITFFVVGYDMLGIVILIFTSFYCIMAFSLHNSTGMFEVPEPLARNISFKLVTILLFLAALTQLESFLFTEFFVLIWYYMNKNGIEDIAEANRVKFYNTLVIFGLVIMTFFAVGYDTLGIEILVFTSLYCIMAFSLNISTGMVGVLNFGVIAQVAVGAYIYGILSVNYGMPIFQAVIWAMVGGAIFSAIIAMTTLRLRDDYFAIISITLGEIIKQIAKTEPTLRSHSGTPAILSTPQPFKIEYYEFVEGTLLEEYSYRLLLGIIGLLIIVLLYFFTQLLLNSPYGRLFKSIREDELVTSTYGKNVFMYKVIALAISGAVAGLGGAYYAWTFNSLFPEQFTPLPTFYAWTILIVGGRANNKGIIIGGFAYEFFNRLSLFYNNQESTVLKSLRKLVGAVNPTAPDTIAVANIQLFIVGLLLIVFIRFYPNGLLPEEPYRPLIRGLKLPPPGSQSEDQKSARSDYV